MKKHFTNLALMLLAVAFGWQLQAQETTYIWGGPGDPNSEFNGGLNDWTTQGTPDSALWVWEADGKADRGAYYGERGAIESPSVNNGAAVFDSDFYDNGGIRDNFGNGIAPAPHTGMLISPVFSCVGHESVWIQFNQYFRQYASETYIEVSIDEGQNWERVKTVNEDLSYNQETSPDSRILVDISAKAANQATVQIRFVFGPNPDYPKNYYFWIIDDVYIVDSPIADPKIVGTWYPTRFETPRMLIDNDSMRFIMDLRNFGGQNVENLKAKLVLANLSTNVIYYEDSTVVPFLGVDDTVYVEFNSYMPSPEVLDTGTYVAQYYLEGEGFFSEDGKVYNQYFVVTPNLYQEQNADGDSLFATRYNMTDGNPSTWIKLGGNPQDEFHVNYYATSDWANNENVKIILRRVSSRVLNDDRNIKFFTLNVEYAVVKLADTIDNLLYNFNWNDKLPIFEESEQMEQVGYASETIEEYERASVYVTELTDMDDEDLFLEPNAKYFIVSYWPADPVIYQAFDNFYRGIKRYHFLTNEYFQISYFEYTDHFLYFTGTSGAWMMDLDLDIAIKNATEDELLPENTVLFKENPVKNELNVQVRFENTVDKATMAISNMNGSLIDMRTVKNLKDGDYKFITSNLPSGTYIFTIFTKDKLLSKKFVVAK